MSEIQSIDSPKWRDLKIGDILTLEYGKALQNYRNGNGYFDVFGTNGKIGVTELYLHDGPSLIIGRKGAYRGVHLAKFPFFVIDTAFYTKNKLEDLDVVYLYYWFKCIDINSMDSGSAIPSTNRDEVYDLDILLPPIEEQKAIASVLSSLDDKIDLLHRQNKTLEAMAETLFRQWFVEEAEIQSENQLTLGELIESVSITHRLQTDTIIFLNTSDIYKGDVLNNSQVNVNSLPGQAKKSIQRNDILFSEIRPANGRWAYIHFDAEDYVVSTKLMVLRSKGFLSQAFVYFFLTNSQTVDWLQLLAESRSGTFPQITFDQLKDLKINIPSKSILSNSIEWCESALKKINSNSTQIRTLETLRDTLLPKLMSGEVRVDYP
ncbi:restriction endonuclease subunit S [Nitrosomonas sp. Is35]|uniref:restriction endonuclease subunit S n=1 Tax=Nitrosomonas sp. Is35 TaxID=3080534 RepID=UPI00294AA2EF|nr:restriction endonuclease subunit S [Nitrosomonas sp. Is35]MDV6346497.1 restriction endonuclease subunit S [Nitrosomonas sp. Is35]